MVQIQKYGGSRIGTNSRYSIWEELQMADSLRRVAILGGMRIPFARSNTAYVNLTNLGMLTAALTALVDRFGLRGHRIGEVAAGAVIKHTRDAGMAREATLGCGLHPHTPAYDVQRACGTSLTALVQIAHRISRGEIDCGIAGGTDSASDIPMRADSTVEKLSRLQPSFDRSAAGTLTAGNSTPLTDGASSVLVASEDWAKQRGLPVQAYLTCSAAAAVDFVGTAGPREGLLMAPTYAVPDMLDRMGITLQDFDLYEIHEAFAAQVLCTLKAWESEEYCRTRLGRKAALGPIDRAKLNLKGSSLAAGHPFAATGTRIVATLAKQLAQRGSGRGLVSVCTAGGMGVTAILER